MIFTERLRRMDSTNGRSRAMADSTILVPPAMFLRMWLALKTSTNTLPGATLPTTETSGCRAALTWDGRRIVTVTGSGFPRGDGPGLKMSPGDMLPSTMAVGCTTTTIGDGRLGRTTPARIILQRWSPSMADGAGVWALGSVSAADTAGARWDSVNRLSRGTA